MLGVSAPSWAVTQAELEAKYAEVAQARKLAESDRTGEEIRVLSHDFF